MRLALDLSGWTPLCDPAPAANIVLFCFLFFSLHGSVFVCLPMASKWACFVAWDYNVFEAQDVFKNPALLARIKCVTFAFYVQRCASPEGLAVVCFGWEAERRFSLNEVLVSLFSAQRDAALNCWNASSVMLSDVQVCSYSSRSWWIGIKFLYCSHPRKPTCLLHALWN